jgi:antitoxin component YwqK of YwqJK toxin-antitoxin module
MWDEEGRLLYQGHHDARGRMDGTWTRWWPDGPRRLRWEMRAGHQHGRVEAWFASGSLRMRGERRDGLPHGEWIHWREDGSVACACRYDAGRAVEGDCDPAAATRCAGVPDDAPPPALAPLPTPGVR